MKFWEIFDKRKVGMAIGQFVIMVSMIVLAWLVSGSRAMAMAQRNYEVKIQEVIDQMYEEQREQERMERLAESEKYENTDEGKLLREEATYCAKVLYGMARNQNKPNQKAIVWCIINRVESGMYPDTVRGVCEQANQWVGYLDANPVVDDMYNTAHEVLEVWHNDGVRPVTNEYLYITWTATTVKLRTTFKESPNTLYWTPKE